MHDFEFLVMFSSDNKFHSSYMRREKEHENIFIDTEFGIGENSATINSMCMPTKINVLFNVFTNITRS